MKISFLITICLISTLSAYELDNILPFMRLDLGIEYRNGEKFIKLIAIERLSRSGTTIYFRGILAAKGAYSIPIRIPLGGMVT
jgi:hypothetical protein